ncbi:MAG: hypothetical protein ACLFN8_00760 [Candidatus Woesearchaeota archaeon]
MGFGTVAANMLFFIAIVTISASVIFYMSNFASETTAAMAVQKDRLSDELRTDISITSAFFDNETNTTTITAANTGKTLLMLDRVEVFLSNQRISRDDFSISVESDTSVGNPTSWDPSEVILVVVPDFFVSSTKNQARIVAPNGVGDSVIVTT